MKHSVRYLLLFIHMQYMQFCPWWIENSVRFAYTFVNADGNNTEPQWLISILVCVQFGFEVTHCCASSDSISTAMGDCVCSYRATHIGFVFICGVVQWVSACLAGVNALTCVGWQVTLCDPIWQVTLRSSVMDLSIKSYMSTFTFFY